MTLDAEDQSNSLWWRPLWVLFEKGKPPGRATLLFIQRSKPFGVLMASDSGRLFFWPLLPSRGYGITNFGRTELIDHVTLDPSNKMHATYFSERGEREHHSEGWRLHEFPGAGLAYWFSLFARWSTIAEQDLSVQRLVRLPTGDSDRRKREFAQYVQGMTLRDVKLPPSCGGDFLYCTFLVVTDDDIEHAVTPEMLENTPDIEGWPDESQYCVRPVKFPVGVRNLVVAPARPPGSLPQDVVIGLPRSGGIRHTGSGG